MKILTLISATILQVSVRSENLNRPTCNEPERQNHPHHCHLMDLAAQHPPQFAFELSQWSKYVGMSLPDFFVERDETVGDFRGIKDNVDVKKKRRTRNLRIKKDEPDDVLSDPLFSSKHSVPIATATKETESVKATKWNADSLKLPTVTAHGMGDSCYNEGSMQYITERVASLTGNYATCVPTGDNHHDDVLNGYFMSMDEDIDIFAKKIKQDPKLSGGFHAIGFSQGNNIIRGYIARYNDPPVHTSISINGVNAGISAVPYCIPSYHRWDELVKDGLLHNKICDALMEVASHKAYTEFSQRHSFQANYWRDPRPVEKTNYQMYSQLAKLGNEGLDWDRTLNENFAKTQKFVWVLATQDTIVWPKEGEQWGAPNPNATDPFVDILPMKETEWYQRDLFGLKSADEEGKFFYEEFDGAHLRFSLSDFDSWIRKYIALEDS
jgi:Palmitoyl protein thioesterase.